MTKQLIKITLAILTTLLALVVLWQFRIIVIYLLISLALAAALRPLFSRLAGRGFVVRAAWILLSLVVLGGFGFLVYLIAGAAIAEIQVLAHSLSAQDTWILPAWLEGSPFQLSLIARLPPPSKLFEAVTGDQGQLVLPALIGFTQGIGAIFSGGVIILILSIYWSINQIHFERLWLSLLPSGQRKRARGIWRIVEPDTGAYIRGQVVESLLAGVLLGLGYWLIGSPYPALLGLAGALACLVPMVGAVLVIVPVLLIGLLTSVQISLFTALYALVILVALGVWVKPRLFNRRWDNPILTVILMIALADAFGFIGIIIAPPISVICQILWSRLVSHRLTLGAAARVSDLKERQILLWDTINAMEEPPPPLIASSLERLNKLMEQAEPIILATPAVEPTGQNPKDMSNNQPLTG
jgi:predicted PurR-regulated permease PerM